MAKKLKSETVQQADLEEYLETSSDFAFELRTLKGLNGKGFTCSHGGTYSDPQTGKNRQYDIRAFTRRGNYVLKLAVECKNLKKSFPLLVSCVPRADSESFHNLVLSRNSRSIESTGHESAVWRTKVLRKVPVELYPPGGAVGKSCAQVGRADNGEIVANDAEVYDKWSQAVNSAVGLVVNSATEADIQATQVICTSVLPVLVVPDDTLWSVEFDEQGTPVSAPTKSGRVAFYLGHHDVLQIRGRQAGNIALQNVAWGFSHIEFMTESELLAFVNADSTFERIFSGDEVSSEIEEWE